MKFFIVFAALFAVALAAPAGDHHDVSIVKDESDVHAEGYHFVSETSDGTHRSEEGQLKNIDKEHDALVVHGVYSWVDEKTGEKFVVHYDADENGFHPEGDHLPKNQKV